MTYFRYFYCCKSTTRLYDDVYVYVYMCVCERMFICVCMYIFYLYVCACMLSAFCTVRITNKIKTQVFFDCICFHFLKKSHILSPPPTVIITYELSFGGLENAPRTNTGTYTSTYTYKYILYIHIFFSM